ncbi:MAG: hypothetical protein HYR91_11340, partial [Flavobacteriia bacterium]|nr:hypothetical protein [Flavobacteriia bacterium]
MKNYFIFLMMLFLVTSCGKKRTIHIIAKNAATEARYTGLEYFVVSSRTGANGEKYKTEAHGT